MAETPEGKVKRRIKALLKEHGAYFTMPVMTGMATNGTPDFAVCHRARYLAIEAKAGDGQPTELQWVRLREVDRAGGSTMVLNENNLGLLVNWLESPAHTYAVRAPNSKRVQAHMRSTKENLK